MIVITAMSEEHWDDVARIYGEGIATKNATFQTEIPTWESWDNGHSKACRLVALWENQVAGWVALSPISSRCVYAGVAEVSIYIGSDYRGKGIGDMLMQKLIEVSEENGFWTLQAGIFPENEASIHLHHKYGFATLGTRKALGKMDDTWRDVALLERRSTVVGID